jgi:hypothetical protein
MQSSTDGQKYEKRKQQNNSYFWLNTYNSQYQSECKVKKNPSN